MSVNTSRISPRERMGQHARAVWLTLEQSHSHSAGRCAALKAGLAQAGQYVASIGALQLSWIQVGGGGEDAWGNRANWSDTEWHDVARFMRPVLTMCAFPDAGLTEQETALVQQYDKVYTAFVQGERAALRARDGVAASKVEPAALFQREGDALTILLEGFPPQVNLLEQVLEPEWLIAELGRLADAIPTMTGTLKTKDALNRMERHISSLQTLCAHEEVSFFATWETAKVVAVSNNTPGAAYREALLERIAEFQEFVDQSSAEFDRIVDETATKKIAPRCARCGKQKGDTGAAKLATCKRCKLVRYCSRKCQSEDWPEHKKVCRPASSNKESRKKDKAMLQAKVILAQMLEDNIEGLSYLFGGSSRTKMNAEQAEIGKACIELGALKQYGVLAVEELRKVKALPSYRGMNACLNWAAGFLGYFPARGQELNPDHVVSFILQDEAEAFKALMQLVEIWWAWGSMDFVQLAKMTLRGCCNAFYSEKAARAVLPFLTPDDGAVLGRVSQLKSIHDPNEGVEWLAPSIVGSLAEWSNKLRIPSRSPDQAPFDYGWGGAYFSPDAFYFIMTQPKILRAVNLGRSLTSAEMAEEQEKVMKRLQ